MKIKLEKMSHKIILAIIVVVILTIIGISVFLVKNYYKSGNGKTKIYAKELSGIVTLDGNKQIISIQKSDINKDEVEDYIVLIGEPKYDDVDTTKVQIFKSLNSNIEMYNNISIEYVNGKDKSTNRYDTKKTYSKDVEVKIYNTKANGYIQVSDTIGNISLLYLNEEKLNNVISNTFGEKDFVGYTIEGKFKPEDSTKLDINLDNYGKDYLAKKEEVYTLDYTNTQVNSENYRLTYMANKFSEFEIIQSEDKQKTYLICIQYILYSNNEDLNKNEGFVKTKFEIKEDKKLEFSMVEVLK